MILYLVRHGETTDNAKGIIQGHLPGKLSENGINQAKKVGERLKDVNFDIIFSSDLHRAVETTNEIATFHPNTPIKYTKELREVNMGVNQGKTKEELKWKNDFSGIYSAPEGGESTEELYNRAELFLKFLLKNYLNKKVLGVSHGGTIKAFISIFSRIDKAYVFSIEHIKNTSVTVIEINDKMNGKFILRNDLTHLK